METNLGRESQTATYTVNVPRAAEDTAVSLWVVGIEWQLSIARVTRVGQDLFIQIRLNGIEDCTATVHVHGRIVLGVTARAILERTCEWLLTRGSERSGFIQLAPVPSVERVPLCPR
jgi:hypothetical protein